MIIGKSLHGAQELEFPPVGIREAKDRLLEDVPPLTEVVALCDCDSDVNDIPVRKKKKTSCP